MSDRRDRFDEIRDALRDDDAPTPDVSGRVLAAIVAAGATGESEPARLDEIRAALRDDQAPVPDVSARVLAAIVGTDGADVPHGSDGAVELHVVAHHVGEPDPALAASDHVVVENGLRFRPRREAPRWLPAAACLVVGLLLGSALVGGLRSTPPSAAAQVPEEVAAAQVTVDSLSARIEITERGWNEEVPERTFAGTIDYQAPESLALHLDDTTRYPSSEWIANDVDLVRRDAEWWARGPRDCPSTAQPACTAPAPRLEVVEQVAPYDERVDVPLDLVVPVRSFLRSSEPPAIGSRTIDGREAIGVRVSAAQLAPLLDGLRPAGNLRELFPTDRVDLWLDASAWTPLRIELTAADDPDRRTWAINRGYVEEPGDEILVVALRDLRVNEGIDVGRLERAPDGGVRRIAGYLAYGTPARPTTTIEDVGSRLLRPDPGALPAGLAIGSTGIVGEGTDHAVVVQTWTSGRGWVKVSSTSGWDGDRLFGDIGSPVRRVDAADGSVRYVSLDGSRVAVHGDGIDVVVSGSFDVDTLDRVAAALGMRGVAVPEGWDEAATESITSATQLLPGLLVPSRGAGFGGAAVRADGNVVTQAYAGAGARGLVVVEAPGERLGPPLDMDSVGVAVRGVDGRFSAARGELEWVEAERVHRLSSTTLSRAELVAIADAMVAA